MSNYRPADNNRSKYSAYGNAPYPNHPVHRSQSGLLAEISDFARRQPLLAMAGALVGGLLLARYLTNQSASNRHQAQHPGYRPLWSYAPDHPESPYRPQMQQQRRPVDHMGAKEEQMSNDFADPSRSELEQGAKGTTGTTYDLDPDSITAG